MFLFPETMSALDTTTVLQNGVFFQILKSLCQFVNYGKNGANRQKKIKNLNK